MNTNLIVTTVITISLAFLSYLVTYLNNLRLSQRKEHLERVNRQLGDLYGPLFALAHASDIAWRAFRSKYRPGRAYFGEGKPPTDEELEAWRLWMATIFMPNNLRMYEAILSKADLLIEPEMPVCLLDLCAHVTAYQVVVKRWENNDYSEYTSLVDYPTKPILEYTRQSFQKLKTEQEKLIGTKKEQ